MRSQRLSALSSRTWGGSSVILDPAESVGVWGCWKGWFLKSFLICMSEGVSFRKLAASLFVAKQLQSVSVRFWSTYSPTHLFNGKFKLAIEYPFIQVRKALTAPRDERLDEFWTKLSRVTIFIFALALMSVFCEVWTNQGSLNQCIFSLKEEVLVQNKNDHETAEEKGHQSNSSLLGMKRQFNIHYLIAQGAGSLCERCDFSQGDFGWVGFCAASGEWRFLQITVALLEVNDALRWRPLESEGWWWPAVLHLHREMDGKKWA